MDTILSSLSLGPCQSGRKEEDEESVHSMQNKIHSISDFSEQLPNEDEDIETKRGRDY